MRPVPPPCPQNATPSSHTKSAGETDRKEISLREEHIQVQHLHNVSEQPWATSSLPSELACWTSNNASGSAVQSITGPSLNTISTNKYLEQHVAPWLPPHRKAGKHRKPHASPCASTLYPRGGFSRSSLHCADHICNPAKKKKQNPALYSLLRQKNRIPPHPPAPPLPHFSKKPPPTGLAGYNGPPKECLPLHAPSLLPIGEQREGQRGCIPLSAPSPLTPPC